MAVPRNRHSTARKKSKRAHHAKKPIQVVSCSNCGASTRMHRVCASCGTYKGQVVIKETVKS
jgi:large subunit ribosomal protein L32